MTQDKNRQILDKNQVIQRIKRIAYQVYENNFQESHIVFAGIEGSGYSLAKMLRDEFSGISPISTLLVKVSINKLQPLGSEVKMDAAMNQIENQVVILVDDVLNTGRTLIYSLMPFLQVNIKKIQTAILVDRNYKTFPISADYVGYALSTTLQEHIQVILTEEEGFGVYLY